jgi:hypothetical protein
MLSNLRILRTWRGRQFNPVWQHHFLPSKLGLFARSASFSMPFKMQLQQLNASIAARFRRAESARCPRASSSFRCQAATAGIMSASCAWRNRRIAGGWPRCEAIAGGRELLEVRCRRCGHESLVDLTEVVWPRDKPVHTLAKVPRCRACKDELNKAQPDRIKVKNRPTGAAEGQGGLLMTNNDAFDLWWKWAKKSPDSPLTIPAEIPRGGNSPAA